MSGHIYDETLHDAQLTLHLTHALITVQSPQEMVDLLREHWATHRRLSSCVLLLYGGDTEDAAPGQRAYLELQGTWSRRVGSGGGTGIRLYLNDYRGLINRLDAESIVYLPHPDVIRASFDPLVRGFLHAERARSLVLIGLNRAGISLGVLLIASDRPYAFSPAERAQFRFISDYLTLNLNAQMLSARRQAMAQHHSALLNAVRDGVIMVLPFDKGGRVFFANRRFHQLFEVGGESDGDSLIDLLGRMRVAETTREELRTAWLSIPPRAPTILRGEFSRLNADGQPIDIAWYSAPVVREGDDQVLGRIYTFHDVTPERTAQRLRAAFLSRVSHELRTPLTSIRGFAEFILESSGDQLPALAREYTEIILASARHLNSLFTDLIEITRAEAGELKLNRRPMHLPDLIIDAVAQLEMRYRARQQQVIMMLDDDLPLLSIDADRIAQVISNLLINAIKYSPEGGSIHISTTRIMTLDDLPPSAPPGVLLPAVLVRVSDQGKGITREEIEQVFMPFYRTEDAKRQKIEGSGLGLAVARSIIEVHRGKIWGEPHGEATGGCFMFTLPMP